MTGHDRSKDARNLVEGWMDMKKMLALLALAAIGLTAGCGGDDTEGSAPVTSSEAPTMSAGESETVPKDEPLGLEPSSPSGEETEVLPGLSITLPDGSVIHDPGTPEGAEETVTYRMPDAVGGLPALQVSTGTGIDIYSETWVREKSFSIDAAYDDVHRSVEQWPGAAQAVAFSWSEEVPLATGEVLATEVASLWLVTEEGQFYSVMAVAPAGELEGSAVLDAMLSAELVQGEG